MTEAPAIDLNRHVYGNPEAPITVVEYGDLECPYCGAAAPVLHELIDESDGRVRLVFRHFPLFQVHPFALTAALAAEAAGDKFWDLAWVLFKHQAKLADPDLEVWAAKVGVADPASVTGPAAQAFQPAIQADYAAGVAAGVRGTPTLFVDDRLYTGRIELRELRTALGLNR
ncbi:DsbA family protein [Cryptosporangium arvum]|uniref:DsbA family protein n=1 Tax=Cryptosporangium arvum TaxID=80871 RepID=UPI0004B801D4|nr:thioredoxin domain-containing protein [Cryptosporangium arvum]